MVRAAASEDITSPHLIIWHGKETKAMDSREFTVAPFDRAVMSWNCSGAGRFELEIDGERFLMGIWSEKPESKKTASVNVDTLFLKKPAMGFRFHFMPENGASVSLIAVTRWLSSDSGTFGETRSAAWGKTLEVAPRSQGIEKKDPESICSPTSLAMILEFHGFKKTTREIADGVFDHAEKIYGNWPFNTAFAHQVSGMETYIVSAHGLEDLEAEIAAGRPVVTGLRWHRGELSESSIHETSGHLMVVAGFTDSGDVVVNDPAAKRRRFGVCISGANFSNAGWRMRTE